MTRLKVAAVSVIVSPGVRLPNRAQPVLKWQEVQRRERVISKLISGLSATQPVLIAGPTASGKSSLALAIAETQGGIVINADASQVFACWRILTARPSEEEEARAPHALFGHLPHDAHYSVGHWLRDMAPYLSGGPRPIIVGGTGLYFNALIEGLADIPETPTDIREKADKLTLETLLESLDKETRALIDVENRARVQRAWEVETSTGRSLRHWQAQETQGMLDEKNIACICFDAPKDWLTPRIEARFRQMLGTGGRAEAEAMRERFDPVLPSCKAIGVKEAMGLVNGTMTENEAVESAAIATRQYAKRQRTWFRRRMKNWNWVDAAKLAASD